MKYNTGVQIEKEKAQQYFNRIIESGLVIELKKLPKRRSLAQNDFLHLTFGIFALETGYTPGEAKIIYKRYANPDLYVYEKNGVAFLKSSTELTTKEMTESFDNWRLFAAEQSIEIPTPLDPEALRFWENRIEVERWRA